MPWGLDTKSIISPSSEQPLSGNSAASIQKSPVHLNTVPVSLFESQSGEATTTTSAATSWSNGTATPSPQDHAVNGKHKHSKSLTMVPPNRKHHPPPIKFFTMGPSSAKDDASLSEEEYLADMKKFILQKDDPSHVQLDMTVEALVTLGRRKSAQERSSLTLQRSQSYIARAVSLKVNDQGGVVAESLARSRASLPTSTTSPFKSEPPSLAVLVEEKEGHVPTITTSPLSMEEEVKVDKVSVPTAVNEEIPHDSKEPLSAEPVVIDQPNVNVDEQTDDQSDEDDGIVFDIGAVDMQPEERQEMLEELENNSTDLSLLKSPSNSGGGSGRANVLLDPAFGETSLWIPNPPINPYARPKSTQAQTVNGKDFVELEEEEADLVKIEGDVSSKEKKKWKFKMPKLSNLLPSSKSGKSKKIKEWKAFEPNPEFPLLLRLADQEEMFIYSISHDKLAQVDRTLLEQVQISNLMTFILSVHSSVTLKGRGPRKRRKKRGRKFRGPLIRPDSIGETNASADFDTRDAIPISNGLVNAARVRNIGFGVASQVVVPKSAPPKVKDDRFSSSSDEEEEEEEEEDENGFFASDRVADDVIPESSDANTALDEDLPLGVLAQRVSKT